MNSRWAAGIMPRNFFWVLKGRLAVSERPGGQAPYHRPVRRREEILWLKAQGITRAVSLLGSNHNLHVYEEMELATGHFPLGPGRDLRPVLTELYVSLEGWLRGGERVLVHEELLSDQLVGVVAGFVCWAHVLPGPTEAITLTERLVRRQLGPEARSIVALVPDIEPPAVVGSSGPGSSGPGSSGPGSSGPGSSGPGSSGPGSSGPGSSGPGSSGPGSSGPGSSADREVPGPAGEDGALVGP